MRQLKYAPERYDEHLCLKVPVTLWLALLFLVRHLLLLGITFLPTTGEEIKVLRELVRPEYLISDVFTLPVLAAAVRRRPQAPQWMRSVWPASRVLLTLSAGLYPLLLTTTALLSPRPLTHAVNEASLISAFLSLAIIAYLWRSPITKDLFRQWPERGDQRPG